MVSNAVAIAKNFDLNAQWEISIRNIWSNFFSRLCHSGPAVISPRIAKHDKTIANDNMNEQQ